MENLWEALAILLLILFSGLGELSKRMRDKTKQEPGKPMPPMQPAAPPQPMPAAPPPRERKMKPAMESRETVLPRSKKTEDPISEMFKKLFDVQDQDIVIIDEPAPPPPKPKTPQKKPFQKKPPEPRPAAKPVPHPTMAVKRPNPIWGRLANIAKQDPLKAAVIYSEILQRPKPFPRGVPARRGR